MKEYKDTVKLIIFTMDVVTHQHTVIASAEGLPHDCTSLLPCSSTLGGVVILTSNSVIYVDQTSRRVGLPVNGWPSRISDLPMPPVPPGEETRNLQLEGARAAFVDDRTLFVVLKDGTVYPVEIVVDGKTVSRLTMTAALAQTTIPAVAERVSGEYLFIGSTVGESVLLKTARVDQEVDSGESASTPAAVVDMGQNMDLDDDDGKCFFSFHTALILTPFPVDIYGDSKVPVNAPANGVLNGKGPTKHKRAVVHLSLCDSLPAYGPIADITFSLAKNGVRGFTSSYSNKSKHGMNRIVRSLSLWLRLAQACSAASRCSR